MNTNLSRRHILAVRLLRASAAAGAAFAATALVTFLAALASDGPHALMAPSVLGLFGPPVIEVLVRPFAVMAAFVGVVVGVAVFLEASTEMPRQRQTGSAL